MTHWRKAKNQNLQEIEEFHNRGVGLKNYLHDATSPIGIQRRIWRRNAADLYLVWNGATPMASNHSTKSEESESQALNCNRGGQPSGSEICSGWWLNYVLVKNRVIESNVTVAPQMLRWLRKCWGGFANAEVAAWRPNEKRSCYCCFYEFLDGSWIRVPGKQSRKGNQFCWQKMYYSVEN